MGTTRQSCSTSLFPDLAVVLNDVEVGSLTELDGQLSHMN